MGKLYKIRKNFGKKEGKFLKEILRKIKRKS
jgi:hypothetical protein